MSDDVREDRGVRLVPFGSVLAMVVALALGLAIVASVDYIRRVGPPPCSPERRHLARIHFARQVYGGRWW